MNEQRIGNISVVASLAGLMVLLGGSCQKSPPTGAENSTLNPTPEKTGEVIVGTQVKRLNKRPSKVIAYYFHNTIRCESCLKIEDFAKEAIEENFSSETEYQAVDWRVLNMEKDENKHFIDDYDLDSPSLVLSKLEKGKEIKWKNLDKVWEHLDDPEEFLLYVKNEVIKFLSGP